MFESFMEIDDHVDARLDRDSEERDVADCHSNAEGGSVSRWGQLIFHVTDVDAFWTHLKERGFHPEIPRDSSWGALFPHARSGWPRSVVCSAVAMSGQEKCAQTEVCMAVTAGQRRALGIVPRSPENRKDRPISRLPANQRFTVSRVLVTSPRSRFITQVRRPKRQAYLRASMKASDL